MTTEPSGNGEYRGTSTVLACPVCDGPYGLDSDGVPFHYGCSLDGDHDVCEPDDRHIPR